MKRLAFLILLCTGAAWGQSPSPQIVNAKVGKQAVLQSKAVGEVAWVWDRRYLPEDQVYHDKAAKTLVVTSGHAVTFLVTAVEHQPTKGFVQVEYLVTFTGGPGPGPGPDPVPDSLEARMKRAYEADKAAGKVTDAQMRDIRDLFKVADQIVAKLDSTNHLYMTLDMYFKFSASKVDQVRKVIDTHLAGVHPPTKDVPLTEELKKAFGVAFSELAKAVEACLAPQPPPGPVSGFRVIFVSESSANHTREQLNILSSTAIAGYLNAKASKDEKGRPAWRRWDKDVDVTNELESWKVFWTNVKPKLGTLPMLVISSDRGIEVLPLPATEADTLTFLKRYGGQ